MEKYVIKKRIGNVKDRKELTALLNDIKKDLAGENYHPFKFKTVCYYCNPNNIKKRYKHFEIAKKSGGKRPIDAPSHSLKWLQICLNEIFKALYTPSDYAMGFVENRNIVKGAVKHVGQRYVLNIDLENFFPSISQARVWKRIQLPPFNFNQEVASTIAGMCAIRIDEEGETEGEVRQKYILPQGAPTSPLLTNAICDKLDRKLAKLAKGFGLIYTRYADDITFSSNHYVYKIDDKFFQNLLRIIKEEGFSINEKKTRLLYPYMRQEVTGITVNEKVNVSKKYIKDLRSILYIWCKFGYKDAYAKFLLSYKKDKGHVKKGVPDMEKVLAGKLEYLKLVRGSNDATYMLYKQMFVELYNRHHQDNVFRKFGKSDSEEAKALKDKKIDTKLEGVEQSKTEPTESLTYHMVFKVPDFLEKTGTDILIYKSKIKKKDSDYTSDYYGMFSIGEISEKVRISRSVCKQIQDFNNEFVSIKEAISDLDKYCIASATGKYVYKGRGYSYDCWIIVYGAPKLEKKIHQMEYDPNDTLNDTLDKLINSNFDLNLLTDGSK